MDNNQQVPVVCRASKKKRKMIKKKVSFILLDFVVPVVEYNVSVDLILLSFQLLVLPNVVNEVVFDIPNTPKDLFRFHLYKNNILYLFLLPHIIKFNC